MSEEITIALTESSETITATLTDGSEAITVTLIEEADEIIIKLNENARGPAGISVLNNASVNTAIEEDPAATRAACS